MPPALIDTGSDDGSYADALMFPPWQRSGPDAFANGVRTAPVSLCWDTGLSTDLCPCSSCDRAAQLREARDASPHFDGREGDGAPASACVRPFHEVSNA